MPEDTRFEDEVRYVDGSPWWHARSNCAAITAAGRARLHVASTVELWAGLRATVAPRPCPRCTTEVVLNALAARAGRALTPGGYHAVTCDEVHTGRLCGTCAALRRYARTHDAIATVAHGRAAILAPGELYGPAWELLSGPRLEWDSSTGPTPPEVSPATWAVAAGLLNEHTTLSDALAAAAGLYAPAGTT